MTDIKRIQLIENYHKGNLTSEEKKQLGNIQAEEPSFQEELDDYSLLLSGLDMLHLEELENNIASWEKQHVEQAATESTPAKVVDIQKAAATPVRSFRRYYSVAAAVVLLLMLPLGYSLLNSNSNLDDVLAYNSAPHIVRGNENATDKQIKVKQDGLLAFAEKDYSESANLLTEFCKSTMDHEASFFLGLSHLRLKQYDLAIKQLDNAITINKLGVYSEEAFWHIAVAYYRSGKKVNAKKYLDEIIATPEHSQKERATVLLKKL